MTDTAAETNDEWGWDLHRGRAVRWAERGPGHDMLGPYPTREAAEHWRQRSAERSEEWDLEDERWESLGADTDTGTGTDDEPDPDPHRTANPGAGHGSD